MDHLAPQRPLHVLQKCHRSLSQHYGRRYALFGIAQFFGAPAAGAWADHYGRSRTFLVTIGISVIGYAIMAVMGLLGFISPPTFSWPYWLIVPIRHSAEP